MELAPTRKVGVCISIIFANFIASAENRSLIRLLKTTASKFAS